MALNGSGSYSPPAPEFPAIPNTLIRASDFNAIINDIAAALSQAVFRDGQVAFIANQSMGGFKLRDLADAVLGTDAVSLQVLQNALVAAASAGTVTAVDTFTADGVSGAFLLGATPPSKNATNVLLNGVYQVKSTYSLTTNLLTLDEVPAAGTVVEIISFAAALSVDNFSGDGVTVDYTLNLTPANKNNTMAFIGGVYQAKNTYSLSGKTVTFDEAPPAGTYNIEILQTGLL